MRICVNQQRQSVRPPSQRSPHSFRHVRGCETANLPSLPKFISGADFPSLRRFTFRSPLPCLWAPSLRILTYISHRKLLRVDQGSWKNLAHSINYFGSPPGNFSRFIPWTKSFIHVNPLSKSRDTRRAPVHFTRFVNGRTCSVTNTMPWTNGGYLTASNAHQSSSACAPYQPSASRPSI